MKEIKNGEVIQEAFDMDELDEMLEDEEVKESKLKTFGLRAKNGFKKHKKKIVAGAIFGLGVFAGVAISNRGNDDEDSYSDDNIFDADYTEVTDVDDSEYDDSEETENEE
jgi:hypothetical protein